ncbi:MAG: hypothetical protein M1157_08380 [Deinococcus sp.]|nr:hypothetical protein [Deinococcus sp.]
MNGSLKPGRSAHVRRVLLAQNVSSHSRENITLAVQVATRLGVEVKSLFIEEAELFLLAELSYARHLGVWAEALELTPLGLAMEVRALANRARETLSRVAKRTGVAWSFELVKQELQALEAGVEEDLLVVARPAGPAGSHAIWLTRLVQLIENAKGPSLLLTPGGSLTRPLVALGAGAADVARALEWAKYFHAREQDPLAIVLAGRHTDQVVAEIQDWLAGVGLETTSPYGPSEAYLVQTPELSPQELVNFAIRFGADMLVISNQLSLAHGRELEALALSTPLPLLLLK